MDASPQTKTCPMCAETVQAVARVCPHCRSRQHLPPGSRPSVFAPWIGIWLPLLVTFVAPMMVGLWWMRDIKSPGHPFEPHREQVMATDSTMHFSRAENTNFICTVGLLKNGSPYAWRALQLEVDYLNAEGKLIDTATEVLVYQELPAGATQAFRVRAPAAAPEAAYASHRVFVRSGRDARKTWSEGD
jgi:hypothetical protein